MHDVQVHYAPCSVLTSVARRTVSVRSPICSPWRPAHAMSVTLGSEYTTKPYLQTTTAAFRKPNPAADTSASSQLRILLDYTEQCQLLRQKPGPCLHKQPRPLYLQCASCLHTCKGMDSPHPLPRPVSRSLTKSNVLMAPKLPSSSLHCSSVR